MNDLRYTLGLDIGITSVGLAVLENDESGTPCRIERLGVRIFDKAEHPKTGGRSLSTVSLPLKSASGWASPKSGKMVICITLRMPR